MYVDEALRRCLDWKEKMERMQTRESCRFVLEPRGIRRLIGRGSPPCSLAGVTPESRAAGNRWNGNTALIQTGSNR
jgi:hypothetical protein